jgi:hypothetical protein
MKRWLCSLLVLATVGLGAVVANAGDEKKATPEMKMDPAMQQAMMAAGAPGENHALMKKLAGNFDYTIKMWMDPSAPPMESSGKRTAEMVMGGRYLQEKYTGDFMGQSFEGTGMLAYDNLKKEWVGTWIDNSSTGIMVSEGTYDGKGTWEMTGESPDPMTGNMMKTRSVTTMKDDNTFTMQMFCPGPDGKEMKMMEMTCKRSM